MKAFNSILFLLFPFWLVFSCKSDDKVNVKDDSEIRFRYFNLENQGWKSKTHSEKVDNINFTATEVPIIYYLLKDGKNEDLIATDSIYEKNRRERIIEFVFKEEGDDDILKEKYTNLDYKTSVEYMSFTIQKDFFVVTSKNDTIDCSGVLFERSFKVSPDNKVLLFFSNIEPNEKIQLVYEDNLFKKGTLKFRFKEPILNL
ncbi:hypothetical protein [Flavobacterium sp. UBA7682]|uniref:hypothetical protein n=1 Tax=Flavobacterium sp. UBA7682 TaxID=1946560 RepID=UPI0025C14AAA|nr:hypothetical protein [Flavobacterium sp. UBA7682]